MQVLKLAQVLDQDDRCQEQDERRGDLGDDHDIPHAIVPAIADRSATRPSKRIGRTRARERAEWRNSQQGCHDRGNRNYEQRNRAVEADFTQTWY